MIGVSKEFASLSDGIGLTFKSPQNKFVKILIHKQHFMISEYAWQFCKISIWLLQDILVFLCELMEVRFVLPGRFCILYGRKILPWFLLNLFTTGMQYMLVTARLRLEVKQENSESGVRSLR